MDKTKKHCVGNKPNERAFKNTRKRFKTQKRIVSEAEWSVQTLQLPQPHLTKTVGLSVTRVTAKVAAAAAS
jgi:hypothetical protein